MHQVSPRTSLDSTSTLDKRTAQRPVGQDGKRLVSQARSQELLDAFCLRMSSHGMCVSRVLMQHDSRYGLEQLSHAHNMADDTLRVMAVALFRHYEPGLPGVSGAH